MATQTDYYGLLGVSRSATDEQIRSAYRKLARQFHPDVNSASDASDRFKAITEAYEVLTDPQRRQRYDMFGSATGGGGDFGIGDLFETFFGGDFRRPRAPGRQCRRCRGEGREARDRQIGLSIPAGIDDGQQLRVAGEGEAGMRGGPTGDLYVLIRLKEHQLFRRDGDDLVHLARLSPSQAALGDEIGVPTIEGPEAKVRVPAGAQHGQMVRVRGKGVPHLGGAGRGDQLVYLDVVVPRSLTKDQRRLYGQLRDLEGPTSQDGDNPDLFGRIKDAMGGN